MEVLRRNALAFIAKPEFYTEHVTAHHDPGDRRVGEMAGQLGVGVEAP